MLGKVARLHGLVLLYMCLACSDDFASDGSSTASSSETGAEGAEEGGAEEGGVDEGEDEEPGPVGPGCEDWEGWWDEDQDEMAVAEQLSSPPEASGQAGRRHASAGLDAAPVTGLTTNNEEDFRATLISEAGVLSTGRNIGVSWCLGSIEPNPQLPGGAIDPEAAAINLERYEFFRTELERATRLWERHSRMNFIHLVSLDDPYKPSGGACDTALEHVWFRAQTRECNTTYHGQTNASGDNEFDPEAGSPDNPQGYDRLLCVGWKFLEAAKSKVPWYIEHESGHIVGLEHEHVRWNQGEDPHPNCVDNNPFVPVATNRILTPPDPLSVMGYPECVGMGQAEAASFGDLLGAYYTFNWTERRVRDMAPQTGGRDQRYWSGNNSPGILWYQPFSDRLLEWRFAPQQRGPLSFEALERCLTADCSLTDSRGHWHPIMGQFAGSSTALDVFMYGADDTADLLLRNEGSGNFEAIAATAPHRAIPVVGNFGGGGTHDQILWYRPGPGSEQLWVFDADGSHETLDVDLDQDGWRIPLTGHFRSRTHWTDIIWFDPRDATVDTWLFNHDYTALESGPASAELLGVGQGTEYLPIIGNFDGDNRTDMFWYTPGPAPDWLWLATGAQDSVNFESFEFAVDGEYHPLVGDFDGDGDDDLLWYRPGVELAGGSSWLWYFQGSSIEARPVLVRGDYVPYVEDFDSDGCTDILWYDPVAPANSSPVWRCIPEQQTFSCGQSVAAPKTAYPIGFATGGY